MKITQVQFACQRTQQNIKVETLGTGALQLVGANGIQAQGDINSISGDIMIGDHIDMQSSLIKGVATPFQHKTQQIKRMLTQQQVQQYQVVQMQSQVQLVHSRQT